MGKQLMAYLAGLEGDEEQRVVAALRLRSKSWPMTPREMIAAGLIDVGPEKIQTPEFTAGLKRHAAAVAVLDKARAAWNARLEELESAKQQGFMTTGGSFVTPDEQASRIEALVNDCDELRDAFNAAADAEVLARPHRSEMPREHLSFPLLGRIMRAVTR